MLKFNGGLSFEEMFRISLKIIINILIIFIIIVLALGLIKTIYSIKGLFPLKSFGEGLHHVITDILSFLVILELFRSFIEYFKSKRFRLHSMMDPFIIFVVRELIVILYAHETVGWQSITGFAILILSMGIIRTLAVIYTPESEKPKC
ncbi:MAG: phosphate-starvation-inducible PsiE family protein [Desulfobacterales bacterium]